MCRRMFLFFLSSSLLISFHEEHGNNFATICLFLLTLSIESIECMCSLVDSITSIHDLISFFLSFFCFDCIAFNSIFYFAGYLILSVCYTNAFAYTSTQFPCRFIYGKKRKVTLPFSASQAFCKSKFPKRKRKMNRIFSSIMVVFAHL